MQLETSATAIETHAGGTTTTMNPIRAKALLMECTVTHEQNHRYTLTTRDNSYTVNRADQTCTCPSSLPDRDRNCEHLQHLDERETRNALSGPPLEHTTRHPSSNDGSTTNSPPTRDTEPHTDAITCNECGTMIGDTTDVDVKIQYATCNPCALENHDIYYLNRSPDTDNELVLIGDLLTDTTAGSYYHNGSTMAVSDFFTDHPETDDNDPVVTVHRRTSKNDCMGLLFDATTIAVPAPLLTKAIEVLESQSDSKHTATRSNENDIPDTTPLPTSTPPAPEFTG